MVWKTLMRRSQHSLHPINKQRKRSRSSSQFSCHFGHVIRALPPWPSASVQAPTGRRCCYAVVPHSSRACLLACLPACTLVLIARPRAPPAPAPSPPAPGCLWVAIRTLPSIAILVCRCGHCPYPLPPLSASNCPCCLLTNAFPLLLRYATGCAI